MSNLINPYPSSGRWLRGNIHTHTTASDGQDQPQAVIDWYAAQGYDFLAITDHNLVLPLADLDPRGMLLVQGEELTHPRSHVVGIGLSHSLPRGESTQEQLDLVNQAGGLAVVAHPNWMGLTVEQIEPLKGHLAIELSNTVCYRLNGKGDSVAWWDALLSRGHRCWGAAVDDCHNLYLDACKGWITVLAARADWPVIHAALAAGSFIASTGPAFHSLQVHDRAITVRTSPCVSIRWIGRDARMLHECRAADPDLLQQASFTLPEDEPYARVEITDFNKQRAWSQPFWSRS